MTVKLLKLHSPKAHVYVYILGQPSRNKQYAYICAYLCIYVCMHVYIGLHAYTSTHTHLLRLHQSVLLNWAFVKALISLVWPKYHTLININSNLSSNTTWEQFIKGCLSPLAISVICYFKMKFYSSIAQLFLRAPHTDLQNIEIQRAQAKEK